MVLTISTYAGAQTTVQAVRLPASQPAGIVQFTEGPASLKTVPYWIHSFKYANVIYKYEMVGKSPYAGSSTTTIPVNILPINITFSNGTSLNGSDRAQAVANSPIFLDATYLSGTTQYADAMQRAEFWNPVILKKSPNYHVLLGSPTIQTTAKLTVPNTEGVICQSGATFGVINFAWFASQLASILQGQGYDAGSLAVPITNDIVLTAGTPGCGSGFYYGGYHGTYGTSQINTFTYSAYLDAGWFYNPGTIDVFFLSHEVAEWMNDPFVDRAGGSQTQNIVPAWQQPGGGGGCFSNLLEVGDATEALANVAFVVNTNGTNYHVTDVAGVSWFERLVKSMEVGSTQSSPSYSYTGELTSIPSVCH